MNVNIIHLSYRLINKYIMRPFGKLSRYQKLAVQGLVIDEQGRILLVRHSYVPGWYFPGGGVKRYENLSEALARELKEEIGLTLNSPARLHGLFANFSKESSVHIALYVIKDWKIDELMKPQLEIIDRKFFALDALPDDTVGAVHRRILEIFNCKKVSAHW